MQVIISCFQDIKYLELKCNTGETLHISGDSGCGKSSIFEAIYWCLYGSLKDVDKRGKQTQRMYVKYVTSDIEIYRQRNPKKLLVKRGDRVYEDALGTEIILSYFGADKDGWIATSYVMQGEPHFILTLPPKERYHVLLRMSMRGEDSEPYVKKLNEKIKELQSTMTERKRQYTLDLDKYEKLSSKLGVGFEDILSEEDKTALINESAVLANEIVNLEAEILCCKQSESKKTMLTKSLQLATDKYNGVQNYTDDGLIKLKEQLNRYNEYVAYKKLKETREVELSKLKSGLDDEYNYPVTKEQITEVEYLERTIAKSKAICKEVNVKYNEEAIAKEKEELELAIQENANLSIQELVHKKVEERNRLLLLIDTKDIDIDEEKVRIKNELSSKIKKYDATKDSSAKAKTAEFNEEKTKLEEQITTLVKEIEMLNQSKTVHCCPSCQASLRYVNGKIEISDREPFDIKQYELKTQTLTSTKEELKLKKKAFDATLLQITNDHKSKVASKTKKLEAQLSELKKLEHNSSELKKCEEELASLPPPVDKIKKAMSSSELSAAKRRLEKLKTIVYQDDPSISSSELQKAYDQNLIRLKIKKIEQEPLTEVQPVKRVLSNEISDYEEQNRKRIACSAQIETYKKDLLAIEEHRASVQLEKELSKKKRKKLSIEKRLKNSKNAVVVVNEYKKLQKLSQECDDLHEKQVRYARLLALINQAVVDSLTNLINSVNEYLETVVQSLFSKPIDIKLSTQKLLKGGGVKQEINLTVNYKGGVVHNFRRGLSCGEKARINTVLTLALERYSDNSILILDEVVSLIDEKKAETLIGLIRNCTDTTDTDKRARLKNKIVLLTSHKCCSDIVDRVVLYKDLLK